MRTPAIRLKLRSLMIAVLVIGSAIGGWVWIDRMSRRSQFYRLQAVYHLKQTLKCEFNTNLWSKEIASERSVFTGEPANDRIMELEWGGRIKDHERIKRSFAERAERHRLLCLKYTRAAARPWDAVAPDPPEGD